MKKFLRFYGAPIAIILLGLIVAFMFMSPAPPKRVVLAGGAKGGAYAAAAESLAVSLRAVGVEAEVLETAGSVDNLSRVKKREADVGIVQTGLAEGLGQEGVSSLGAMYYEPLWVFHRKTARVDELQDLKGLKLAIGPDGSGVRVLASLLLEESGVKAQDFMAMPLAGQAAAAALKAGEVDAAMVVSGPTTAWIADLLRDPSITLMSMKEAHAMGRRHPYLDEWCFIAAWSTWRKCCRKTM